MSVQVPQYINVRENEMLAQAVAAQDEFARREDTLYTLDEIMQIRQEIRVEGGRIEGGPINSLDAEGHPCQRDIVLIGGQTWQVYGDTLGELEEEPEPWCLLRGLPIPWRLRPLSTKRKARFSAWGQKFLPSRVR